VTEVDIMPIKPSKGLIAFANFTLSFEENDKIVPFFYVSSIGVYKFLKKEGYYIRYPQKKLSEKKSLDICHPINKEIGDLISSEIDKKVKEIFNGNSEDI
tara:strand:+ start:239 stop:538 length:300 start_codon:yes stop_codon:yes gene_type:complete